ncbi:MAG: hypothetical protein A2270_05065 [Elusimicrobia bacterium RIFOXYA12_FULL_51_18]|nr:MAG: hypothetical protein A2270_05065 [Elusimicrobia bacterium RIFOXYA12_FULL_51_18]OGS28612.1 MAG: hypothetical protein A2218_07340 [Elusimicrobia bacterium RIFOXYA2_FULL_53_38]
MKIVFKAGIFLRLIGLLLLSGAGGCSAQKETAPVFVVSDFIELDKIAEISLFRSSEGHDYSGGGETCRSMKHYFKPKPLVDPAAIKLFSPVDGIVEEIVAERVGGRQLRIRPESYPGFRVMIFHVNPRVKRGGKVSAGEELGLKNIGSSMSDIAVQNLATGEYVSYFSVMSPAVFAKYVERGISSGAEMMISRESRDSDALSCDGEIFLSRGKLKAWKVLK